MTRSLQWYGCFLLNIVPFITSYVVAQTDTSNYDALAPVTITATRRPVLESKVQGSVFVIKNKEIQGLHQTTSLEESLREIPGVFVNNRFNFSQGDKISIRGLGSRSQFGLRSMKVLLDGIPLTFPDGTTQLNNLNLSNIEKVEILKGPSSSLYGNSAAGIILLYTQFADTSKLAIRPRISAGSYGFLKGQIDASGTIGKSKYMVSAAGTNFEGYRSFSQARFYNANGVFQHKFSERTHVTAVVNIMNAPYMFNPGGLNKAESMERPREVRLAVKKMISAKKISQSQAGIQLERNLKNFGEFKTTVYGIQRSLFNPIFGRVIDVHRVAGGIRNVYEKQFSGEKNALNMLAGLDIEIQQDDRKEFKNEGIYENELG